VCSSELKSHGTNSSFEGCGTEPISTKVVSLELSPSVQ
jgi:hypothetical protein